MAKTRKHTSAAKPKHANKRGRPRAPEPEASATSTCSSSSSGVARAPGPTSPPVKQISTGSKSPPCLQRRKKVKISNDVQPSASEVVLETVECHGNVFLAWLTRTGKKEGEGFYTKPIDDALEKTSTTNELYPHPLATKDCPGNKSMQDLFAFHYYLPRRESRGKNLQVKLCFNNWRHVAFGCTDNIIFCKRIKQA